MYKARKRREKKRKIEEKKNHTIFYGKTKYILVIDKRNAIKLNVIITISMDIVIASNE